MRKGATVGEGDELGEGVGPLRAAKECSMSALRADKGCGFVLYGEELARGQDGAC